MPETCGHQCSLLRQGLCIGCRQLENQKSIKEMKQKNSKTEIWAIDKSFFEDKKSALALSEKANPDYYLD